MKNYDDIPDLSNYKKAILVHGVALDAVKEMLRKYTYTKLADARCFHKFSYTTAPEAEGWVYLRYAYSPEMPHYYDFYFYQELMVWLSRGADRAFCLAASREKPRHVFLSMRASHFLQLSTVGMFDERPFRYIGDDLFDLGKRGIEGFDVEEYLKMSFGFELRHLPHRGQEWQLSEIALPDHMDEFTR
ncbi:MAG: hypothetical protein ACOX4I_01195 [Anaerovoracaceae bacterium]|jgi:hypothetical protein